METTTEEVLSTKQGSLGVSGTPHVVAWDMQTYMTWGQGAGDVESPLTNINLTGLRYAADHYVRSLDCGVDLTSFELDTIIPGQHDIATDATYPSLVLRYTKQGVVGNSLGGEHISFSLRLSAQGAFSLLGFTNMTATAGKQRVGHQDALEVALSYLKNAAPDLVAEDAAAAILSKMDSGQYMDFTQEQQHEDVINNNNKSKLQVLWIGEHEEKIRRHDANSDFDSEETLHFMKVKMYNPDTNLFTWVMVDDQAQVVVFERDILWDDVNFKRLTQMPLHDRWQAAAVFKAHSGLFRPRKTHTDTAAATVCQSQSPPPAGV